MTRLIHILAILATAALLIPFVVGCQPNVTPQSIAAAGGTATGQLQGAKADVIAAMPHADQYGKGLLTSAETAIAHVLANELPALEAAGPALEKVTKEAAADHAANKWLGWEIRNILRGIIIALAAISFLSIVFYFVAGTNPVGIWKVGASIAIKIFAFFPTVVTQIVAWVHMHKVKQDQLSTAVTNTLALPPGTLTAPPTPTQLKVLAKPRQKHDPPLTAKLDAIPPVIGSTVPPVV